MAKKRVGHVRIICPHCGKGVTLQRPRQFQRDVPCSRCRIPISSAYVLEELENQLEEEAEKIAGANGDEEEVEEAAADEADPAAVDESA